MVFFFLVKWAVTAATALVARTAKKYHNKKIEKKEAIQIWQKGTNNSNKTKIKIRNLNENGDGNYFVAKQKNEMKQQQWKKLRKKAHGVNMEKSFLLLWYFVILVIISTYFSSLLLWLFVLFAFHLITHWNI